MSLAPFDTGETALIVLVDDIPLEAIVSQLRSVRVESQIYLPSVAEIEFSDPDMILLEETGMLPGNIVEIRAVSSEVPEGLALFSGQIATIETRYNQTTGLRSVVRAYDAGQRMLATTNTRGIPYSTYSEIVELIAGEHGIDALAFPTAVVYDSVVQSNETDWDFLVRLAREVGYVMYIGINEEIGLPTLYFSPATPAEEAPPAFGEAALPLAFEIGDERILSLTAMVSGTGLSTLGSAVGWDQMLADPAIGEGIVEDDTTAVLLQPELFSAELGGEGQRTSMTKVNPNEAATETASEAYSSRLAAAYANVEIELRGNPSAMPMSALSLLHAGGLTGDYTITAAVHEYLPQDFGYRTHVTCSGREDRTLAGLGDAAETPGGFNGVFPAIVVDVEDPEQMGRVLLSFPWLDIEYVSPWARVVQAGAGEITGWQIMPEPTDEVLVAFTNGQLDTPYVLGGLYSAEREPGSPWEEVIEGVPMQRVFTSRDGHQLIFDDSPENSSLTLNTTFGASCMIRMSPEEGILITTIEGQPITITSEAEVTVNAEGAVLINASEVTINGEGAVTIAAEGELSITAASLNFESEGEISMTAPAISIEGAEISLEGAEVNVAGGIVTLGA